MAKRTCPEFWMDPTGHIGVNGDSRSEIGPPESPTSVYYLFTADHVLLYVGITSRGPMRLGEHAHEKTWWEDVAYSSFEHFPTRAHAEMREAAAIKHMEPLHNKVGGVRNPSPQAINPRARFCAFPDCGDAIHAKKLCHRHYVRQLRAKKAS